METFRFRDGVFDSSYKQENEVIRFKDAVLDRSSNLDKLHDMELRQTYPVMETVTMAIYSKNKRKPSYEGMLLVAHNGNHEYKIEIRSNNRR